MSLVLIGCGFVAKYPEGGGNFSVPLQYALGLRRMNQPFWWLEVMESTGDEKRDLSRISQFRRRLAAFGLEKNFCLVLFPKGSESHDLTGARFFGRTRREVLDALAGPTVLLNLSNSIRRPLIDRFSLRKLCSLDPTEVCFWMQRMDMGQHDHEEFWTIGLNTYGPGSRVPETAVRWKTFFPLVDTTLLQPTPRPPVDRFTTIGQWYWDGMIQWEGEWRDFSKKAAFEKFLPLAMARPSVRFELSMNLSDDDPEKERLQGLGWHHVVPHRIARTPRLYYDYLRQSTGEFSAVKLESYVGSGWLSDRSAAYLALGRPVISESTLAEAYLPEQSGMFFVSDAAGASAAVDEVLGNWGKHSRAARNCAVECFDAVGTLRKMLA